MNASEAKEIFLQALPELSEPLKSAVEFTLANWHKLNREARPSTVAINFFASLPALPSNDVDDIFSAKLNEMTKLLRTDLDVWLSLENLPHEQWRDIIGCEGRYKVSNYGRVKSFQHNRSKIMSDNKHSKGYMLIRLYKNGHSENFGVHTLVAQAFTPNPEKKSEADHRNGNKTDNCIWNLDWVTRRENATRAYQLGLIPVKRGVQSHFAKLTAGDVIYIRINPDGLKTRDLAEKFNVSRATINRVKSAATYKDVL